jgi:hypothetical protein
MLPYVRSPLQREAVYPTGRSAGLDGAIGDRRAGLAPGRGNTT